MVLERIKIIAKYAKKRPTFSKGLDNYQIFDTYSNNSFINGLGCSNESESHISSFGNDKIIQFTPSKVTCLTTFYANVPVSLW